MYALLAAWTLVSLYESGCRISAVSLGAAAMIYFGLFLVGYLTQMHGDRPRWAEATQHLQSVMGMRSRASEHTVIYGSVPGVVAYYLGVPPGETMGHPLVQSVPMHPPSELPKSDQWYVMEAGLITPEYAAWFAAYCELWGSFEARTGPKDRSVLVYHCNGRPRTP
jgi:hypothetical protein